MPGRPLSEYEQPWLNFSATARYADATGVTTLGIVISQPFSQEALNDMIEHPHYFGGEHGLIVHLARGRSEAKVTIDVVSTGEPPTSHQFDLIESLLGMAVVKMCREAIEGVQPGSSGRGFPTRESGGRAMTRSKRGNGSVLLYAGAILLREGALEPLDNQEANKPEA